MARQPLGKIGHLFALHIEFRPGLLAPAGRPEARHPQLGAKGCGQLDQLVEFRKAAACEHAIDTHLDVALAQVFQRIHYLVETTLSADGIVGFRTGAVQADLDVNQWVIQSPGDLFIDQRTVGTDAGDNPLVMGVVHQIQKIGPHEGFTAADIELKHFAGGHLVDHLHGLGRGQLAFPFTAGIRQTVNTA